MTKKKNHSAKAKKKRAANRKKKAAQQRAREAGQRCGLCGKTTNLIKTECCDNWICDDEHEYVMFSYDRNSCSRNHRRYTLCGYHYNEGHDGNWKDCAECRSAFETEMYVWYGTNEHNFEKLPNPPSYEPTHCAVCGRVIRLGAEGYASCNGEYWCERCTAQKMREKW